MPRTSTRTAVPVIDPNGVYTFDAVCAVFGCERDAIRAAISAGRLHGPHRAGHNRVFLGQWLLAWMSATEVNHEVPT